MFGSPNASTADDELTSGLDLGGEGRRLGGAGGAAPGGRRAHRCHIVNLLPSASRLSGRLTRYRSFSGCPNVALGPVLDKNWQT